LALLTAFGLLLGHSFNPRIIVALN